MLNCFKALSLTAVVTVAQGSYFSMPGGIGPEITTSAELNAVGARRKGEGARGCAVGAVKTSPSQLAAALFPRLREAWHSI